MSLNDGTVDIVKSDETCSPNFVADNFSGSFLHPLIHFIKDSRSAFIIDCVLSGFLY